jgi:tRNA(Arg) A34 adenosine deaminase TadA
MPKKSASSSHKKRRSDTLAEHRHWLAQAESVASQPLNRGGSPHPSVKVGAVLVDAKGEMIAASANRFAYGVDRRRPERYKDGAKSLWMNCAEQLVFAAALRKRAALKGAKLYVTLEPCAVCAGLIAELHLKQVFVPVGSMRRYARLKAKWKNSIEIGLIKLAEAGVALTAIDVKRPSSASTAK